MVLEREKESPSYAIQKESAHSPLSVSVIIVNYNYEQFLPTAVESCFLQTYKNIEVIVVDDGSTDGSREVIGSFDNRIISIFKENGGQASALNAGFNASHGDIICLLDADDLFLPEKVSQVVNLFQFNSQADWVFTESAPVETAKITTAGLSNLFEEIRAMPTDDNLKIVDFRHNIRRGTIPDFMPSTSNLCLSRRLSEELFPLPEVKGLSGVAISDLYIKTIAVGLGVGCTTTRNLGVYRFHDNYYKTLDLDKKRRIFGEINTMTGYWMDENFPEFREISRKILTKGFATYLSSHYLRKASTDADCSLTLRNYLRKCSSAEKLKTHLFVLYYQLKLKLNDFV